MNRRIFKSGIVICVIGLIFCANCGKSETEKKLESHLSVWEKPRSQGDTIDARDAVVAMSKSEMPLLLEKLKDEDIPRYGLVEAFARIKGEEAVDALLGVLGDEDSKLAAMALRAMPAKKTEKIIDGIISALEHYHYRVRVEACKQLAGINSGKVIGSLARKLSDSKTEVCTTAAEILEKSGSDLALEKLVAAALDPGNKNRDRMLQAVGHFDSPKAITVLKAFLNNEDRALRYRALDCLGKYKSGETVELCAGMLKDRDNGIRVRAVEILGETGSPEAVDLIIGMFETEKTGGNRLAALKALSKTTSERIAPLLLQAVKDPSHEVRKEALIQLVKMESPLSVTAYEKAFDDRNRAVRGQAAASFVKLESKEANDAAERLLFHRDAAAREAAARQLEGAQSDSAASALVRALENEQDKRVRDVFMETLQKLQSPLVIAPLLDTFHSAKHVYLKKKVIEALQKFATPVVIEFLIKTVNTDADRYVRVKAINAMGYIHTAQVEDFLIEQLKGDSFYIKWVLESLVQNGTERVLRKLGKALLNDAIEKGERRRIIDKMKSFQSGKVFEVLIGALAVDDMFVLGELFDSLYELDPRRLAKELCKLLEYRKFPNRPRIAGFLRKYKDDILVVETLGRMLDDEDNRVGEIAQSSLRKINSPEARKILKEHTERNRRR